MFKLDFSNLNDNGFKINRLRLIHSTRFLFGNFSKSKDKLSNNDDLTGERNLIVEYLTESNEIAYTRFLIFAGLMYISAFFVVSSIFMGIESIILRTVPIVIPVIFHLLARKSRETFVMRNIGIGFTESIYNSKIRDKFNL